MRFIDKLNKIIKKNNSLVCVGLDSDIEKIPNKKSQFLFNKNIIDATYDLVCSYKLNIAFYQAIGLPGLKSLELTVKYLESSFPEIPIIIDEKLGDIGNTNYGYVQFIFDYLRADAVTVNPYLGEEAIRPFLERKDKGIIVLCRTSNPSGREFQDLSVMIRQSYHDIRQVRHDTIPLYQYIAYQVVHKWNKNRNCLLVVGATYPNELKKVREITGDDIWFLVPGIGAQGGDLETTLKAGLNKKKTGLIISSSRGIIFSKNPREETKKLKEKIDKFRV